MNVTGKIFIAVGLVLVIYTLFAHLTGNLLITDLMPLHWFMDLPKSGYYKLIPTEEPSNLWLQTVLIGGGVLIFGCFLVKASKKEA